MKTLNELKVPICLILLAIVFFIAGMYVTKEDKYMSESIVSPPAVSDTGIKGTVMIGPTCGGPIRENGDCADKPYSVMFKILTTDGTFIKYVTSDANGKFMMDLPTGEYKIVEANPKGLPRMSSIDKVVVKEHVYTTVDIKFDSGIR